MKHLLIFIFSAALLFADIDATIEAIKKAPVSERFKLMNAFKKEIIRMQEKQRIQAIEKLKTVTKSKYGDHALKEIKKGQQTRKRRSLKEQQSYQKKGSNGKKGAHHDERSYPVKHIENHIDGHIEDQIDMQIDEEIENAIENQMEDERDDDD